MNDYLFALILSAYIIGGVFIVLWMDRNYLMPNTAVNPLKNGVFGVSFSGLSFCRSFGLKLCESRSNGQRKPMPISKP